MNDSPSSKTRIKEPDTGTKLSIILYNDDVNTFDYVTAVLQQFCGHGHLQAHQCALLTHYKGKCSVKNGNYNELEMICSNMKEAGLKAKIE
jgi:ATP-dependent Clp protease adaptor protein ClpS